VHEPRRNGEAFRGEKRNRAAEGRAMVGDMKRRRKQFEDKVKKVQKAPRIRPLLGPGSSRSLGEKKREREWGKARREGERGERDKRGEVVVAGCCCGWTLLLLLAVLPRSLLSSAWFRWDGGWDRARF